MTAMKYKENLVLDAHELQEHQILGQKIKSLKKIFVAISRSDYPEAAIRISQARLIEYFPGFKMETGWIKKTFDPAEARDGKGRWTGDGNRQPGTPNRVVVVDPYCKLVKELCIVEATSMLEKRDYGAAYFKTLSSCLDRHGCLGRA